MDNKRKVISYNDIKNTDDTRHKHNLENTLDYYNDDMTRQVVGHLLDDYIKEDEKTYYAEELKSKTKSENENEEISENEGDFDDGFGDDFDDGSNEYNSRYDYEEVKLYSPRRARSKRKTEVDRKTKKTKKDAYEEKDVTFKDEEKLGYTERHDYEKEIRTYLGGNPSTNINFFKRTIISLIIVFLVILSLLIYKMNKMTVSLSDAETQLREFTAAGGKEALDSLNLQITNLTAENKKLKEEASNQNKPNTENKEDGSTQPETPQDTLVSEYIVKSGDSVQKISKKLYGTQDLYKKILDANNLSEDAKIYVGQKLTIPPK